MSTQATQCRERAFKEFAEAVQDAFGERIHEIILYGSTARGEATKQSDVDVSC
jgi:predicted nucleotidyltransferase